MTTPSACVGDDNANAQHDCAWLILEGACSHSESDRSRKSPSACCASLAPGSHCKHTKSDVPDGECAVPIESGSGAGYDFQYARRMLHFAGAAYCDGSQVESWSCGEHCNSESGIEMLTYINHKLAVLAGFVGYDRQQDAIVVSFRGTVSTSIIDWINNLSYTKAYPWSKYPKAGVHHGFNDAWNNLKSDVVTAISAIRAVHSTTKVLMTGHSLGAAIAINAAMDLKLFHGLYPTFVDFGRPRAGDAGFAEALAAEGITGYRITHHNDLVPHAPPEAMGFYHTPREVYYAGSVADSYTVCDGSGEDPLCSDKCSPLFCTSVSDHLEYMGFTMGGNNCAGAASTVV